MKHAVCLAAAVVVAACSNLGEMREKPPDAAQTVPGDYEVLASCVADIGEKSNQGVPTLRVDRGKKTARLYRIFEASQIAHFELTFTQQTQTSVLVEGRGMNGRASHFGHLWSAVATCVAK